MFPLTKRAFLKLAGLSIAPRIVPPLFLKGETIPARTRKVIIVTFGGGVRYAETFAPEGLHNIPRLAAMRPNGFFYRNCINSGVLSHFNSTASIVTGNWQRVDDFGFQPPASATLFDTTARLHPRARLDAWVIATNKSFASMGSSGTLPFGANVVLPKQLLLDGVKEIVNKPTGGSVADRNNVLRRLEEILHEGYEGVGWTIFKGGMQLDKHVQQRCCAP